MGSTALAFVALLLVAAASVQWFRAALAVRLPENRSRFVAMWIVGTTLAVASLAAGVSWPGGVAAVLSILGSAFFLFTIAISRQEVAPDAVRVGALLPGFTAIDDAGGTFDAKSLAGRPVLLKFFRGHW